MKPSTTSARAAGTAGSDALAIVRLPVPGVIVNLRVKGGLHLRGGAGKADPIAAASRLGYGESLRLQPGDHLRHIARAQSEICPHTAPASANDDIGVKTDPVAARAAPPDWPAAPPWA